MQKKFSYKLKIKSPKGEESSYIFVMGNTSHMSMKFKIFNRDFDSGGYVKCTKRKVVQDKEELPQIYLCNFCESIFFKSQEIPHFRQLNITNKDDMKYIKYYCTDLFSLALHTAMGHGFQDFF